MGGWCVDLSAPGHEALSWLPCRGMAWPMAWDSKKIDAEIILQNKSASEFSEESEYVVHRKSSSDLLDVYLTMKIESDHLVHNRHPFETARRIGEDLRRASSEKG